MKKIVSLLAAAALCLVLGTPARAAANDYTFTLETDSTAAVGDTITVKLSLSQSGGGSFDLYAMQDYVRFDTDHFSYVEDSLSVYTVSSEGQEREVFSATPLDYDADGTVERIFVNRAGTSPETLDSGVAVLTFQLRVKAQGTGTLSQGGVEIFRDPTNPFGYTAADASVSIRAAGGNDPLPSIPSGGKSYAIITESSSGGKVSSDRASAVAGTKVTITVTPDNGFALGEVSVVDASGKALDLVSLGNGKYSFTMPAGAVTVKASFAPVSGQSPFEDVKAGDYYYDAVLWAVDKGITTGVSATRFDPNGSCTRAQAVTFLWRAMGSPAPTGTSMSFTDVPADSYYYSAVLWAVENGVTTGTSATTFSPDAPCDRGQIVTFLHRAMKSPAASAQSTFSDVAADAYYAQAVAWAVENGVTTGTGDNAFSPTASCSRSQIVTFLYRAMNK